MGNKVIYSAMELTNLPFLLMPETCFGLPSVYGRLSDGSHSKY